MKILYIRAHIYMNLQKELLYHEIEQIINTP